MVNFQLQYKCLYCFHFELLGLRCEMTVMPLEYVLGHDREDLTIWDFYIKRRIFFQVVVTSCPCSYSSKLVKVFWFFGFLWAELLLMVGLSLIMGVGLIVYVFYKKVVIVFSFFKKKKKKLISKKSINNV